MTIASLNAAEWKQALDQWENRDITTPEFLNQAEAIGFGRLAKYLIGDEYSHADDPHDPR